MLPEIPITKQQAKKLGEHLQKQGEVKLPSAKFTNGAFTSFSLGNEALLIKKEKIIGGETKKTVTTLICSETQARQLQQTGILKYSDWDKWDAIDDPGGHA